MKKMVLAVFILSVALLLSGIRGWALEEDTGKKAEAVAQPKEAPAPAPKEEKPSFSADLGFFSQYVWRGFGLSNNSVVVEPSLTAGYRGFSVNVWGNLDTKYDDGNPLTNDGKAWTETDYTLAYERKFGHITTGVGYIYYALTPPTTPPTLDSEELYMSVGADILLAPTLTVYREIAHYPGWYLRLGISHSFALPNSWSLDLGASAGYYAYDDNAMVEIDDLGNPTTKTYRNFHDGTVSAGLTIPVGKYFTIAPTLSYSFPLSNAAKNFIAAQSLDGHSDHLYGGVNFSMAF